MQYTRHCADGDDSGEEMQTLTLCGFRLDREQLARKGCGSRCRKGHLAGRWGISFPFALTRSLKTIYWIGSHAVFCAICRKQTQGLCAQMHPGTQYRGCPAALQRATRHLPVPRLLTWVSPDDGVWEDPLWCAGFYRTTLLSPDQFDPSKNSVAFLTLTYSCVFLWNNSTVKELLPKMQEYHLVWGWGFFVCFWRGNSLRRYILNLEDF